LPLLWLRRQSAADPLMRPTMSLLVILMCLRGLDPCTQENAPMVLREPLTNARCEAKAAVMAQLVRDGVYRHPPGGWYVFNCEPMEPKA
jgi:hypothetical protein